MGTTGSSLNGQPPLTTKESTVCLVQTGLEPAPSTIAPSPTVSPDEAMSSDIMKKLGDTSAPSISDGAPALEASLEKHKERFTASGFFRFIGCGLLMSVAYLDPGNLEADINVGQQTGYTLLWFTLVSNLCFGYCYQCLSGKVGLVTGEDLAQVIGKEWPTPSRWLLWIFLEVSVIAADIQETVGCSIAISILSNGKVPLYAGAIIVSATAFGLLYLDRLSFRYMELVYLILIGVEATALGVNCFMTAPPADQVVLGIVTPKMVQGALPVAIGALGALVMPYNMYYQSHVVTRRNFDKSTPSKITVLIQYMRVELWFVLAAAFVVNLFVVVVFAEAYYNPESMANFEDIGLQSAASYLAFRFGSLYKYFWAVGLLASGQVATLTLTYAGQVIMLGLLNIKLGAEWRMISTRCIALIPTVTLAVIFQSTDTFDKVASTINILQSILLPFGLIPCIHMSANLRLMGQWCNVGATTLYACAVCVAVLGVDVWLLVSTAMDPKMVPQTVGVHIGFGILIFVYVSIITYFAVGPPRWPPLLSRARVNLLKTWHWLKTNRRWADIESMLEVHC